MGQKACHIDSEIIKKYNLLISGQGWVAEVVDIFSASKAKSKCPTEHGTVVLAEVLHGMVPARQTVSLMAQGNLIATDLVVRLEEAGKEITNAMAKQEIGLCLQSTRLRTINRALSRLK